MAVAMAVLTLSLVIAVRVAVGLQHKAEALQSSKQSLSTRYGKTTEQFLPLVAAYPYDSSNFRFIGSPIDGVQFEEDRVILVEFKTSNSKLTPRQRQIKDLVTAGKVEFKEVRV